MQIFRITQVLFSSLAFVTVIVPLFHLMDFHWLSRAWPTLTTTNRFELPRPSVAPAMVTTLPIVGTTNLLSTGLHRIENAQIRLNSENCDAAFSPDARHLAVVDGTSLSIVDLTRKDMAAVSTVQVPGAGSLLWTSHRDLYLAHPTTCSVISLDPDVVTEAIDKLESPRECGFAVDRTVVIDRNGFATINDSSFVTSMGESETNAFEIADAAISPQWPDRSDG